MKLLLDECIDRRLAFSFSALDVKTVSQMGWTGVTNGRLLALAEQHFDVFITVDRNLSSQQNIPKFGLAVVVLHAVSNRLVDLMPLVPAVISKLPDLSAGTVTVIAAPTSPSTSPSE